MTAVWDKGRMCFCTRADGDCSKCLSPDLPVLKGPLPTGTTVWSCETPSGWVCPKCGRVWSPGFPYCHNCNRKVSEEQQS